jgi:hypothetical protein
MTSRERVIRALEFDSPGRAPRDLWALPGVVSRQRPAYDAMLRRYPLDLVRPPCAYGPATRAKGTPAEVGVYTDEWGCEWTVAEPGVVGEVKHPPLDDWARMEDFTPPWELLDQADFSMVDPAVAETDGFTIMANAARTFERMQFLRGTENLFMDLAMESPEVFALRDMVAEYNLRDLELWLRTDVDAVMLMDDWGAQGNLLISPAQWRALFKPVYAEQCARAKAAGKYVFMHSDGYILPIIEDLIEIGVDALNAQIFCMGVEELARRFKGRITFWGELDRQQILPFGTVEDVRNGVRRVRAALDDGRGGLFAQCEWGNDVSEEKIAAVFETWME